MNKRAPFIPVFYVALLLIATSCSDKKSQQKDIIIEKVTKKPQAKVTTMANHTQSGTMTWISGAKYTYKITRTSNHELPVVENHGARYYDNALTLTILRSNGTECFNRTFTKAEFAQLLPAAFRQNGVLLGMGFNEVQGKELHFVVSVGAPDETYEDFYSVQLTVDNFGATSISEYNEPEIEETSDNQTE